MKTLSLLASVLSLLTISVAYGDDTTTAPPPAAAPSGAPARHHGNPMMKAAFEACAKQLGLPAPTPGQRPNLTSDQKQQLDACIAQRDPHFHPGQWKEMKECLKNAGVQPGTKPTQEQLQACHQQIKGGASSSSGAAPSAQ